MNSLAHQILEVLQSSSDGHATAFNVFNVLNRAGLAGKPPAGRHSDGSVLEFSETGWRSADSEKMIG
jgi:hypothetical protein